MTRADVQKVEPDRLAASDLVAQERLDLDPAVSARIAAEAVDGA